MLIFIFGSQLPYLAFGHWENFWAEGHPFNLYKILCNSNLLSLFIISPPTNFSAPTKFAMKNIIIFLLIKESATWPLKQKLIPPRPTIYLIQQNAFVVTRVSIQLTSYSA